MALALAASLVAAAPAFSLPVGSSPDTRPAPPELRPQWKNFGLDAQLSGTYLGGNARFVNIDGAFDFNANSGKHQLFLSGGNLFTKTGDSVAVNRVSGSVLYDYQALSNLNLYAYTTHAHDQSILLNYRVTEAAGLCLHHLRESAFSNLLVSFGPALEQAWFSDGAARTSVRGDLRVYGAVPLGSTLDVGLDTFYRPVFVDISDYRLYGEAFLRVKLTEVFSLQISGADENDSRPRPGILSNDFGVFTTLKASLGW